MTRAWLWLGHALVRLGDSLLVGPRPVWRAALAVAKLGDRLLVRFARREGDDPFAPLSALVDMPSCPACGSLPFASDPRDGDAPCRHPWHLRLVYCSACGRTHAVMPGEQPCAPGAWLDSQALR